MLAFLLEKESNNLCSVRLNMELITRLPAMGD